MSIVFFDLETGGLQPESPDIQLAAVAVDHKWDELESFQAKIRFDESKADPEALKLNHYDKAVWLTEAQEESIVAGLFGQFLNRHKSIEMTSKRGAPYSVARLAGHNAASFDGPRIQRMFQRHGMFLPAHPQVLCTLGRALWYAVETGTAFKSLKLTALCEHFGILFDGPHDALADVRASIQLARVLQENRSVAA